MRIYIRDNGNTIGIWVGYLWFQVSRRQAERLFDLLGMALIDVTDEELDALLSSED